LIETSRAEQRCGLGTVHRVRGHPHEELAPQRRLEQSEVCLLDNAQVPAQGPGIDWWLIPIGYVAIRSALLPRVLGWLLIIGGAGYIVGALLENALLDPPTALVNALLAPATIAELGTIVYLLLARAAPLTD
jgi:Domain of unknown function (DUF4386)